jgi:hypothetical protein
VVEAAVAGLPSVGDCHPSARHRRPTGSVCRRRGRRTAVKSALPWFATLLAGVLLFTPTYGIGVALSPLTLIGSCVALSPPSRASAGIRAGAASNLLFVVAGLALLTVIWWPTGRFRLAVAWALFLGIVPLSYTAVSQRRGERGLSGDGSSAV